MDGENFKLLWDKLSRSTDGWNWYWLSYGEKCYAFAVVTAFPLNEKDNPAKPGTRLEPHETKERLWVDENGTDMLIDDWICNIERQNGDTICQFISGAFAYAKEKYKN